VNLYYLGIDRQRSIFAQGIGPESRHTFGGRVSGRWKQLDFNYDLIGQIGAFMRAPVRAWAVSTDTGVALKLGRFPARLGVTVNSPSGDRDPADPRLQAFNPLFPGNAYSGIVGLLGLTNITDLTPSLKVPVRPNLVLAFEALTHVCRSTRDGLYSIDQRLIFGGQSNRER
jgi:hypothetical protein